MSKTEQFLAEMDANIQQQFRTMDDATLDRVYGTTGVFDNPTKHYFEEKTRRKLPTILDDLTTIQLHFVPLAIVRIILHISDYLLLFTTVIPTIP